MPITEKPRYFKRHLDRLNSSRVAAVGSATREDSANKRSKEDAASLDKMSASVSTAFLSFLALLTYVSLTAIAVTDEQLLREVGLKLPIVSVELPLQGFFAVSPWLIIAAHLSLLLQVRALAMGMRSAKLEVGGADEVSKHALRAYPLTQALAQDTSDPFIFRLQRLFTWIGITALPLLALLVLQYTFLPFHSSPIIWTQRTALLIDVLLIGIFHSRIWHGCGSLRRGAKLSRGLFLELVWKFKKIFRRSLPAERPSEAVAIVQVVQAIASVAIMVGVVTFATGVLAIPDEPTEISAVTSWMFRDSIDGRFVGVNGNLYANGSIVSRPGWKPVPIGDEDCSGYVPPASRGGAAAADAAILKRHLNLAGLVLVKNELKADTVTKLRSTGFDEIQEALKSAVGMDLRGRDLRGADFRGALIVKADLRSVRTLLDAADFSSALVFDTKFGPDVFSPGQRLSHLRPEGANLINAKFIGSLIVGSDFSNSQLASADFRFSHIDKTTFDFASLKLARFTGARAYEAVSFGQSEMRMADFSHVCFKGVNFRQVSATQTVFSDAQLQLANFSGAHFQGARISTAALAGACFTSATFRFVNFSNSDISHASFDSASIVTSWFHGLKGEFANFNFQFANGLVLESSQLPNLRTVSDRLVIRESAATSRARERSFIKGRLALAKLNHPLPCDSMNSASITDYAQGIASTEMLVFSQAGDKAPATIAQDFDQKAAELWTTSACGSPEDALSSGVGQKIGKIFPSWTESTNHCWLSRRASKASTP